MGACGGHVINTRRILVGVDGSVGSDRALRWSIELARELDAEIVAVHVLELPRHPINLVRFIEVGKVSDKALGDELQATFEGDWCAPLHDAGVKYRTILAAGPPAPALLSLADAEDASMVVVGSRGRGSFTERLLVSVTMPWPISPADPW